MTLTLPSSLIELDQDPLAYLAAITNRKPEDLAAFNIDPKLNREDLRSSWIFGGRGDRNIHFRCRNPKRAQATEIPGVVAVPDGVICTPDAAPFVAAIVDQEAPAGPSQDDIRLAILALPGFERFKQNQHKYRKHQRSGGVFLALRPGSMICDGPRTGKCGSLIAACELVEARRTLIVTPAMAVRGWAKMIAILTGEEATACFGRAGTELRRRCMTCNGSGKLNGNHCPACKYRNGQSTGWKYFEAQRVVSRTGIGLWCPIHGQDVGQALEGAWCGRCLDEVDSRIEKTRWLICNWEILSPQIEKAKGVGDAGQLRIREDLPGWIPRISRHSFDVVIGDELHYVKKFSTEKKRLGLTRRDAWLRVSESSPMCFGATATPMDGLFADYWSQLDSLTRGAAVSREDRKPFAYHVRYCCGRKGDRGWTYNGKDEVYVQRELLPRLDWYLLERPKSECSEGMPEKRRELVEVDTDLFSARKQAKVLFGKGADRGKQLVREAFAAKLDTVIDSIMEECAAGMKNLVLVRWRESAEETIKALARAIKARGPRMRQVSMRLFCLTGEQNADLRSRMCEEFSLHTGAACAVATSDSLPGGVSLSGLEVVHTIEIHERALIQRQAEDRGMEAGAAKSVLVRYYFVPGSVDERFFANVLRKVEALELASKDGDAGQLKKVLQNDQELSLDEMIRQASEGVLADEDD